MDYACGGKRNKRKDKKKDNKKYPYKSGGSQRSSGITLKSKKKLESK
jgi:hypothetical protein